MEELKEQLDRIEANQKEILANQKIKHFTAESIKKLGIIGFRNNKLPPIIKP